MFVDEKVHLWCGAVTGPRADGAALAEELAIKLKEGKGWQER